MPPDLPKARASRNRAGILMMVLAMSLVPLIDVLAKFLVLDGIPALQVVFLRMLLGTLLLLPVMLLYRRPEIVPPQGWGSAFLLGVLSVMTGVGFFGALKYLSIADTAAISFVQPLFVILLSKLFLGEAVGLARWLALFVGFAATLLIIRPGMGVINPGSLLALGSGAAMAGYVILVRKSMRGAGRVSPVSLTFQTHAMALVVAIPIVMPFWQGMDPGHWGLVVGLTLVGLAGQYLIIRAYDFAEASLIAPLAYLEIVSSTLASWLFFSQVPDAVTFIGIAVLIASSLFVTFRSAGRR